jgi:hypothetical protein
MLNRDRDPEMPGMSQVLPHAAPGARRMSRAWIIVGLALGAWLLILVVAYGLWRLLT